MLQFGRETVEMLLIFRMLWEMALFVDFSVVNGATASALVRDDASRPSREYEDFVLEQYKQRLSKKLLRKNLTTIGNQLDPEDSALKNVVIETKDTSDGLTKYRALLIGVKDLTYSGATILSYQFRFVQLLSVISDREEFRVVNAELELIPGNWMNRRIFVNGFELTASGYYTNYDLSLETEKWLKDGTKEAAIQVHCEKQCPKAVQAILIVKLEENGKIRQKRGIRTDQDCSNRRCCLKTRYFQFRSTNFEHIAAPDGFMMNFCDGICDQSLVPGANDRDTLVQAMKISNLHFNPFKHKWVCCVPIRFASVNITEWHNEVVQRSIPLKDVKVEECGCVI